MIRRELHPSVPRTRRGIGIVLVVVMVVLLAGCLVTAARQVHASRVTNATQSVVAGALALQAATAAVEEALWSLGQRANDPGDPLFSHLRQEGLPSDREQSVPTPRLLAQLRLDPLTASVSLAGGGVRVALLTRRRIGLAGYEHEGRVRLVAEAVHVPTGTLRRLTREHTLRVNHLSTPRPFDQFTWMALSGERLLDPNANARIAEAVEALTELRTSRAPALSLQVRDTVEQFNQLLDALSGGESARRLDATELARPFAPERFPAPPAVGAEVGSGLHWFPQQVVLFSKADRIDDLARLHLTSRADRVAKDAQVASEAAVRALTRYLQGLELLVENLRAVGTGTGAVSAALTAYAAWLSTLDPLADALTRVGESRSAQLGLYAEYQDSIAELTGTARSYILDHGRQLDPAAFRARAGHRFEGPDAAERAVRFLAGYMGPAAAPVRGLHAVVFIDNLGGRPLSLDALRGADGLVRIRGKLTLAVTGAVELRNVVLAQRQSDLFVVHAGGSLSASERVEASLIAGDEFRPTADLVLAGNLILAGAFDPARLSGRLDRDGGRYFSGAGHDLRGAYTQACLAPWPLVSHVSRSAP